MMQNADMLLELPATMLHQTPVVTCVATLMNHDDERMGTCWPQPLEPDDAGQPDAKC